MSTRVIHSVGIDIGTTTTQVIFSELELVNRAPASQVPHYEFSRRDISYVSPVIFTPLDAQGQVQQAELAQFINDQYSAAGLTQEQVESGAIIITGETSKARNARSTIMELAHTLGDFVVATAGPHLESIIAGHGSGASEISKENASRVLNIDIGGGTSNYVVFEGGRVVDSACLNIGGHLIETFADGRIKTVHEPGKLVIEACFPGQNPQRLSPQQLTTVMQRMAELVVEVAEGHPSPLAQQLLMTDSIRSGYRYDLILLSGGVGECYYHPIQDAFRFSDTGPLLADALHLFPTLTEQTTQPPRQTVRATVIGAGSYTLSLSGSTIWLSAQHLPIRNVPVLHIDAKGDLSQNWQQAAQRMDLELNRDLYALAIPTELAVTYATVVQVAQALRCFHEDHPNSHPLLVIARQDLGKALGMELQPFLGGRELAVIDEIETREGDYVDIGKPLFGGEIVPLTIKSLAFPT